MQETFGLGFLLSPHQKDPIQTYPHLSTKIIEYIFHITRKQAVIMPFDGILSDKRQKLHAKRAKGKTFSLLSMISKFSSICEFSNSSSIILSSKHPLRFEINSASIALS
jgi:hypothetical protein